ncbi:MAG: hypothetical protein HC921_01285 [Synechococcaceae cyanobacterium SM2_3_1]|nr:hypothetical protein [Synechococcaceae cyanobacterium SM2_3_1]
MRRIGAYLSGHPIARLSLILLACGGLYFGWSWRVQAQTQPEGLTIPNPQQFRALEQSSNPLSFSRAEELSAQANAAIQSQNYEEAIRLLQETFNAYNQRSNFHQQLSTSFAGIQNRITESERDKARDAAQLRDQSAYDLAIVYRAAGRPEEAVAQLVQVIGSQGPTRELGRQAYQQLLEIGFVDTPFDG